MNLIEVNGVSIAYTTSGEEENTPVLMIHGHYDSIIPLSLAKASRDMLINMDYKVKWIEYPMMHEVCEEEIHVIGYWLEKVLCR